jgi:hypothetical protein
MTKEALKLALEALEDACGNRCNAEYNPCFQRDAITAIKAALANEALERKAENARELGLDYEQEQHQDWCASLTQMLMSMPPKPAPCSCKPLQQEAKDEPWEQFYPDMGKPQFTPPQRKPLTDEEISNLWSWSMTREAELTATTQQHAFARAIETKLRSKNT